MNNYYYTKKNRKFLRRILRVISLGITVGGIFLLTYLFFPLLSWQIYFAPVFASQSVAAPIPKTTIVSENTLGSLISEASRAIGGADYGSALNWFPNQISKNGPTSQIKEYFLSIPKLNIKNAVVSTQDYNLDVHLVNYIGTAVPPDNGTAVIFGHSTLPQWFNAKDYKTIFANAYKLEVGDEIFAEVSGITYRYKIYNTVIVHPDDTSVFAQNFDTSYITLVTCTPPGTTWKRLLIKARLQKL